MTAQQRNRRLAMWMRAIAFGAVVWAGLRYMGTQPAWFPVVAGLTVAGISLASTGLATIVAIVVLCIPIIIVNSIVGVTALVLGLVALRFLDADGSKAFLAIGATVGATLIGPAWAGVVLAGVVLGAGEGAVAAALAALIVQALGLATGHETLGVLFTGGPCSPLLGLPCPVPVTSPSWFASALAAIDAEAVDRVIKTGAQARQPLLLLAQPVMWAAAAAVVGASVAEARKRRNILIEIGGVGVAIVGLAISSVVARESFGAPIPVVQALVAAIFSLMLGLVIVAVAERVFRVPAVQPRRTTAQDDAEVDELLRTIASAEETLAERHTVDAVVLMSDMKSFAEMTEQDGSVASAKAIQRHRDLLLPVVERHDGRGKPSGGDGLVAAFDDAASALRAASEMQRVLRDHNAARPGERALAVRIGVARGEVVVDRSGRPFIGVGLNLAARVMGLADGGQSFATASLAREASGAVATRDLGAFELKNIAEPVDVVEILWAEGATDA